MSAFARSSESSASLASVAATTALSNRPPFAASIASFSKLTTSWAAARREEEHCYIRIIYIYVYICIYIYIKNDIIAPSAWLYSNIIAPAWLYSNTIIPPRGRLQEGCERERTYKMRVIGWNDESTGVMWHYTAARRARGRD
jgi:hypothetical protein